MQARNEVITTLQGPALSEALLRAGLGRQQGSTVAAEGTVKVESLSDPHSTDGNLLVLVCLPGLR